MSEQESTPLLSSSGEKGYYFLKERKEGSTASSNGAAFVEELPEGSHAEEFEPKVLGAKQPSMPRETTPANNSTRIGGLFSNFFKKSSSSQIRTKPMLKPRKAPIKVEPKVFFANERTFLAWMHIAIILAGASIAILAFADENDNPGSQIYGIVTLPVAVAFIVYAMYQYVKRAYMIRNKLPGPYDDTVGPTVLGIMLMLSIVCQFAIKLYSMSV